jgi:hypothetical protein
MSTPHSTSAVSGGKSEGRGMAGRGGKEYADEDRGTKVGGGSKKTPGGRGGGGAGDMSGGRGRGTGTAGAGSPGLLVGQSPQVPAPHHPGAPGTPSSVRCANAAPKTEVRAKTQPGQARIKRLAAHGEDGVSDKPAANAATMSRAGVKPQSTVRRGGPALVPGGEDWWAEVEALAKTAQGSSRLLRDRLFHEKLLAVLDAPLQAEAFEHVMLKKLGMALKTVANLCSYTTQPPETSGVSAASTGKQLPMASVTRKMVALLELLLGESIKSLMSQLGGKQPAKLTAETARSLGLALRKLACDGVAALSEDMIQTLARQVPAAMKCVYETAPVVRMYMLEMLSFLGQQAGEQPQHPNALAFYRGLCADSGVGDPVWYIVQSIVADGGTGMAMVVGGGETPHKGGQEVASAVQALADLVHVSSASVLSFPVGEEGGVPLRDAAGEEAQRALECAFNAAKRVYECMVHTPGALAAVLHRARVSDGAISSHPGIQGGGWKSGQAAALRLLVCFSSSLDACGGLGLEAAECGKLGHEMLALACSPEGLVSSGSRVGGATSQEEHTVNEVRAMLAAAKLLARDAQACAAIAADDAVLLSALSSRLCSAPDRAVKVRWCCVSCQNLALSLSLSLSVE